MKGQFFVAGAVIICCILLFNSCRKDDFRGKQVTEQIDISNFKEWFSGRSVDQTVIIPGFINYSSTSLGPIKLEPMAGTQQTGNTTNRLKMKPDWTKAVSYHKGDSLIAEVPVDPKSSVAFSFENISGRFDFSKTKSVTRFLFIQTPRKTRGTYMTIIGTDAYLKGNVQKLKNNTLRKKDKDFSGYVLYHSLNGYFLNGYLYYKGKVVNALLPRIISKQQAQPANTTFEKLQNAAPTCETYYITQYYEQCTDWYNGGGDYMYTSCNYWSETSYFDVCTEGSTGNGGGSGDPPPGDGGPDDPCDDGGNGGIGVVNSNGDLIMSIVPDCGEEKDCAGVVNGTAYWADCGCIGGTTGRAACPPPCNTFDYRIVSILQHEGGFVNNPNDPGGATNKGIAWETWQNTAQSILGKTPTLQNLQNLTDNEAKLIYKNLYWDKIHADDITDGDTRYLLFDFYVNASGNAIKVMQRTLNQLGANLTVDGGIGPQTIAAINNSDPVVLYNLFKKNRQGYYNNLAAKNSKLAVFLNGWTNRVNTFKNKYTNFFKDVNC